MKASIIPAAGLVLTLLAFSLFAQIQTSPAPPTQAETQEKRDARMAWWREAKFGMFIHWGLYSVPAGTWKDQQGEGIGEWIMFTLKIPIPEYEQLVPQFNPVKFNAAEWVRLAKAAGQKYLVITSKHHDGFALFDSAVSDYDIMATPFGRDPLKELAEECQRQGIRMCFYHSILDWHHPDYLPRGEGSPRPWDTRPVDTASLASYLEYMKAQLRELLTNYGPIGILWFDGGWEHTPEELHSEEVVALLRDLQPGLVINNRIMIPQDYDTPEQYIPATGLPGRDWEVCMTMNDTWGYKSYDENWKSTRDLVRKLVDIVSKGGNFLLNVGPTAEGVIPQASVDRLHDMGRWMNIYSESIYGTTASVFKRLGWGRCTVKPGRLFLHVFDWPADGRLAVPGLMNDIEKAYLLADLKKTALAIERSGDTTFITLPPRALDPNDTVVVLEIEGEPQVAPQPLKPEPDGTVVLKAVDADLHGQRLRYEEDKDAIGYWSKKADSASWLFQAAAAGDYEVELTYACDKGQAGSDFEIVLDGQTVSGRVEETGSWKDFASFKVGAFNIPAGAIATLTVAPVSIAKDGLMNLRSIVLRPVAAKNP